VFKFGRRTEQVQAPESDPAAVSPAAGDAVDPDAGLVAAARSGDLPSFNALVVRHERTVYAVCYRMLRDVESAEDATQDTFIKAWSSLSSFRGGTFRPWLLKIATNRCYDLIRARGRRPADSLDAELTEVEPRWTSQSAGAEDPEVFAARTELSTYLERALQELPDDGRMAIILSDVHGHPYEEVAGITGVAVGTVKSRISRSRARLREALAAQPEARELFDRFARHYDQ
jgi:RNA polymerase sigma-70 factor, ECF subfamily